MEADKKIRVNCLNWDEAWELFQTKVGQKSLLDSDPKIRMLAESVTKECDGLPLALIVTGRTMASKKRVEEWNHAVTTLRKYAADFSGMADKVFLLLQFSYDSLPNDSIRSCFLFCSLYPEDHMIPIEALIQQWIGEGYIDKFDDWQEANDLGHENIGILKAMCLLESADLSTVKMHDVIRDLAHWIACDYGKDKDKILAKKCSGLKEEHEAWKWAKAQSILLWNTGIVAPPDDIPECSRLSTLLFIMPQFWHIPKNIFLSMPTLRVLEVSSITGITLKELPTSIGNLVKLEYLNLSGINFKNKLPEEKKKLVSLKYLFLGDCNVVPLGVIKNLRSLQTLQLDIPGFGDGEEIDRLAGIQEVECLPRLICLQTCIPNLKDLQCFLSKDRLVHCTWDLWIGSKKNDEIRSLIFSPSLYSSACLNLGGMQKMQKLRITDCRKLEELAIDNCRDIALFKCLERLELSNLPELVVSWDGTNHHGSRFTNLRDIEIYGCDSVVNLNWLCLAPRLQVLDVSKCSSLEGIILEEDSVAYDENTFSSLKQLKLSSLPVLKSICSYALPFPSLKDVDIHNCPELKRLSPDSISAQNPSGEQLRMGK